MRERVSSGGRSDQQRRPGAVASGRCGGRRAAGVVRKGRRECGRRCLYVWWESKVGSAVEECLAGGQLAVWSGVKVVWRRWESGCWLAGLGQQRQAAGSGQRAVALAGWHYQTSQSDDAALLSLQARGEALARTWPSHAAAPPGDPCALSLGTRIERCPQSSTAQPEQLVTPPGQPRPARHRNTPEPATPFQPVLPPPACCHLDKGDRHQSVESLESRGLCSSGSPRA